MRPTAPEVSDVFRAIEPRLTSLRLSSEKNRIFKAIVSCRTQRSGSHVRGCDSCGYKEEVYNSCWNRHCPKCRGGDVFSWVNERLSDLLPVPYFHVVFTLPHEFKELVLANKELLYNALFEASSETLLDVTKNNLSLKAGFFGVLHTWNQELQFHPHVHYLVAGGGLHVEDNRWCNVPGGDKFFLPVRILGEVFRGKFIAKVKALYRMRKLYIRKAQSHLGNPREFEHFISRCAGHKWVVYAKRPFSGPEVVIKYLASYTHKVGISNSRIQSVDTNTITFSARGRENPTKRRAVTLSHETFVRRFLQHGLPKGFRRIRYFGFMAIHKKKELLSTIRAEVGVVSLTAERQPPLSQYCPCCGASTFHRLGGRKPHGRVTFPLPRRFNSRSLPVVALSP